MRILGFVIFGLIASLSYGQNSLDWDSTFVNENTKISIVTKLIINDQMIISSIIDSEENIIDTIYVSGLSNIEFVDFNSDKNLDILISYIGNNPIYNLYLYDSQNQRFVKIDGFENFPESKPLNQKGFYYSYHRAGCADANWVSDLFRIDNFKIKHLANLYGQGCDFDTISEPQKIEIFKIVTLDKIYLLETLNYEEIMNKYEGDKWLFLIEYWNKNYERFK